MTHEPLSREALEQQVIAIIRKKKKLGDGIVGPDSTFAELGIDSLDGMDLLFEFEDTYNLSIPDETAQQMRSVRQVVDSLRAAIAHSSSRAS